MPAFRHNFGEAVLACHPDSCETMLPFRLNFYKAMLASRSNILSVLFAPTQFPLGSFDRF